ncbi:hypothetical protein BH10BAC4_BH10BAC4_04360 [soil metagenome]
MKILKILLSIALFLVGLYHIVPKSSAPKLEMHVIDPLESRADFKQEFVDNGKSTSGVKLDNHPRIVWAASSKKEKTNKEIDNDRCIKSRNLSYDNIKEQFPFNTTAKVIIISFKRTKEEITKEIPRAIPITYGKLDPAGVYESKVLSDSRIRDLYDTLINFNYAPKFSGDRKMTLCWEPRNAIVFYDRNETIVGYVEFCFQCRKHSVMPESLKLGDFCDKKYDLLKDFFKRSGIQYGTAKIDVMADED